MTGLVKGGSWGRDGVERRGLHASKKKNSHESKTRLRNYYKLKELKRHEN